MCNFKKIRNKTPYQLLQEYNISFEPPIDLSLLLQNIGISTISYNFEMIEKIKGKEAGTILGAVFSNQDDLGIFFKESDSVHRQKFTIAHELAHCCLHCPVDEISHIQYRYSESIDIKEQKEEREANIFAGQLLIPKVTLVKYYENMIIPTLSDLSDIFSVSTSVMAARLDYLKLSYYKDTKIDYTEV